jgi:hypothetical protein
LRYESRVTTPENAQVELPEDKYLVFANPFDLAHLFVFDGRMRILGVAQRDVRACRADTESVKEKFGRVAKRDADWRRVVNNRHSAEILAAAELRAHNTRVIESACAMAPTPVGGRADRPTQVAARFGQALLAGAPIDGRAQAPDIENIDCRPCGPAQAGDSASAQTPDVEYIDATESTSL